MNRSRSGIHYISPKLMNSPSPPPPFCWQRRGQRGEGKTFRCIFTYQKFCAHKKKSQKYSENALERGDKKGGGRGHQYFTSQLEKKRKVLTKRGAKFNFLLAAFFFLLETTYETARWQDNKVTTHFTRCAAQVTIIRRRRRRDPNSPEKRF